LEKLSLLYREWLKTVTWSQCSVVLRQKGAQVRLNVFGWHFSRIVGRVLKGHLNNIEGVEVVDNMPSELRVQGRFLKLGDKNSPPLTEEKLKELEKELVKRREAFGKKRKEREEELGIDKEAQEASKNPIDSVEQLIKKKQKITRKEVEEIANSRNNFRLLYQLACSLLDTFPASPPVLRLIVVSGTVNFNNLHKIIQISFGWKATQKFRFVKPDGTCISKGARGGLGASKTKWIQAAMYQGDTLTYEYGKKKFFWGRKRKRES
jgi:hypothetical protein